MLSPLATATIKWSVNRNRETLISLHEHPQGKGLVYVNVDVLRYVRDDTCLIIVKVRSYLRSEESRHIRGSVFLIFVICRMGCEYNHQLHVYKTQTWWLSKIVRRGWLWCNLFLLFFVFFSAAWYTAFLLNCICSATTHVATEHISLPIVYIVKYKYGYLTAAHNQMSKWLIPSVFASCV